MQSEKLFCKWQEEIPKEQSNSFKKYVSILRVNIFGQT